jgi:16S rRNA (guanine(1405)-N(7))-methyltransferase
MQRIQSKSPDATDELEAVVASVTSSRKYRSVCPDTIRRIAASELAHRSSVKDATKATKRRLHQVYAAFEEDLDYDAAYQQLAAAYRSGSDAEIRSTCRRILALHSSTRERLPILDTFYHTIFEAARWPRAILDLGCGLNPLALPWMDLAVSARYVALDIDSQRISFLNRYLPLAGLESLARCQDVLVQPPDDEADLALFLKMSSTLERQEAGSTLRLLEKLNTPFVAVSFAVKSLGGREKGMLNHYARQFLELAQGQDWQIQKLVFEKELAFVIEK